MSNYAALLAPICIGGSLNNSGTPNVNGKVWAYIPGTTTPATIYADPAATVSVTQPITLDTGGRVPYSSYPNGVYTTQPIRLLIQDASGNGVSDTTFESGAGSTGIDNATPSVTTAPFTGTTQASANAAIQASLGGQDAKYMAYAGATARTIQSVLRGIQLTPEDFGAVGDGSADDTTAVQAMVTKLVAVGGGRGYFAKSYKVNSTIVIAANAAGLSFVGAGQGVASIATTSTADIFSASAATDISFSDMAIVGSIGLTGVSRLAMRRVTLSRGTSTSAYALSLASCAFVVLEDAVITGGSQVVSLSGSTSTVSFNRCRLGAGLGVTTVCIDIAGTTSSVFVFETFFNAQLGGVTGMKWESGATGTGFNVTDCPTLGGLATPVDIAAITNDPGFSQRNCGMDFVLQDNLVADGTHTYAPNTFWATTGMRVTSGASTINLGTPVPIATAAQKGKTFTTFLYNNGGSSITWVIPAGAGQYITTVSPGGANGNKIQLTWMYDGTNWLLRSSGVAA